MAKETKLCKHCQTEIPKKAKICPNCKKKQGGIVKWIVIALVILSIIGATTKQKDTDDSQKTNQDIQNTPTIIKEENKISQENQEDKQENIVRQNKFEKELEQYNSGEYFYITLDDLSKYHANMVGVKIYCIIEVNEVEKDVIQSTITDGYMKSNFNTTKDYTEVIKSGDSIAIMGEVGEFKDYSFMGKSIQLNDCMVFAKGEDSKKFQLEKSQEALEEYFKITEDVANSNKEQDISKEEYIELCKELSYNDILRNPDNHEGLYCKLKGKVDQIIEGWFGSHTIYVEDSNGNKWKCSYSYQDGESHLLEGDSVTVYGKCDGTSTSTTVLGKQIVMPDIDVKYIQIR